MIKIDKINMPEVLRYLGYKGQDIGGDLQGIINEAADECLANIRPSYMYRLFPVMIDEDTIYFTGSSLSLKSKNLADNIRGCTMCALLCATIGSAFDNKLRLLQATAPTKAVVFNSCGSTLAEQVVDAVEAEILETTGMKKHGYRFSPGYGDLDISAQQTMFRLLTPEKYTGVNLSPSNILIPIKSVSAILGLSDEGKIAKPQKCGICSLRQSCEFRKRGTICGNS